MATYLLKLVWQPCSHTGHIQSVEFLTNYYRQLCREERIKVNIKATFNNFNDASFRRQPVTAQNASQNTHRVVFTRSQSRRLQQLSVSR